MKILRLCVAVLLVAPRFLPAQWVGGSLGRVTSTVDWQYPPPSEPCDFCVVDAFPNASRVATAGALTAAWRADRWIGATTELRYAPRGYAVTQPTLRVDYLDIPVLARLGKLASREAPVMPFFEAGPAVGMRVRCRVYFNTTSDPCRNGAAFGQDWAIRRFEATAIGGGGVSVRVGSQMLLLRAQVEWGLRDIGGAAGVPTKHRATSTSITWMGPLR